MRVIGYIIGGFLLGQAWAWYSIQGVLMEWMPEAFPAMPWALLASTVAAAVVAFGLQALGNTALWPKGKA